MRQKLNYWDYRRHFFNTPPKSYGLDVATEKHHIYGLVMDVSQNDGVVSLYTLANGYCALYSENGLSIMDNDLPVDISDQVYDFIRGFDHCIPPSGMYLVQSAPLPECDYVAFYALSSSGLIAFVDKRDELLQNGHLFNSSFMLGNDLLNMLVVDEI